MENQIKNKIILVDGPSLLFRMFFGLPAKIPGKDGKSIHGTVGFIGSLLKINSLIKPTHLLVVFDSETGSFRDEIVSDYKGNRIRDWSEFPDEENPYSQLSNIRKALDYLKWVHCEIENTESDDVIAAYVRNYQKSNKVVIVSHDTDLLQLVGLNTTVFYPRGKKSILYGLSEVENRYGIKSTLLADLKALTGDKTDNITGIPGVGLKTAGRIIQELGNIDKIFQQISKIYPEGLRSKIAKHKDKVYQNLSLIKLDHEVNLPFDLSAMCIQPNSWNKKTMKVLREIDLIN